MFYFDYLSGLIELLSAALFFTCVLFVWCAWIRVDFSNKYALISFLLAIGCVMTHERYAVGLITLGFAFVLAELNRRHGEYRIAVVVWSLSLGFVPLILFAISNAKLGTLPLLTGTNAKTVEPGIDAIWASLVYCYNIFLGGNYGHVWFWGALVDSDRQGRIVGLSTAAASLIFLCLIFLRKGYLDQHKWFGIAGLSVTFSMIAVASLTGTEFLAARFAFPASVCLVVLCITVLKNSWRFTSLGILLLINCVYLFSGSFYSISNVYSSRAANALATALSTISVNGRDGIVLGNNDNAWTIGGGAVSKLDLRPGDTFSHVNLNSNIHIEPFLPGDKVNPDRYDFALLFTGYYSRGVAGYRLINVKNAMVIAGMYDIDQLPTQTTLAQPNDWQHWQWSAHLNEFKEPVTLRPGFVGTRAEHASTLDGKFLVYTARVKTGTHVPMRLQVNWNSAKDSSFISALIEVVYPTSEWHSYSVYLSAPTSAAVGIIYANLHDGADGEVELKSVELK